MQMYIHTCQNLWVLPNISEIHKQLAVDPGLQEAPPLILGGGVESIAATSLHLSYYDNIVTVLYSCTVVVTIYYLHGKLHNTII